MTDFEIPPDEIPELELTCEICRGESEHPALGVACSSLGAISFAMCRRCVQNQAEPFDFLRDTINECGGLDQCAAWVRNLTTWKDGRYVRAEDIPPWTEAEREEFDRKMEAMHAPPPPSRMPLCEFFPGLSPWCEVDSLRERIFEALRPFALMFRCDTGISPDTKPVLVRGTASDATCITGEDFKRVFDLLIDLGDADFAERVSGDDRYDPSPQ
jgi:hypothetical protein